MNVPEWRLRSYPCADRPMTGSIRCIRRFQLRSDTCRNMFMTIRCVCCAAGSRCAPAGIRRARRAWLADLRRDFTRNRMRRWGQALVLAAELPEEFSRLHSHFLHTPASVTRYTSLLRDLPWTCSAHAKDIWTSPDWELDGQACVRRLDRHLHRIRLAASVRPGTGTWPCASGLSRAGPDRFQKGKTADRVRMA